MSTDHINDGVQGIYETHLPVRNLANSVSFYRDKLGLTLAHEVRERKAAFLWVGGKSDGMLGLWETGSAPLGMSLHFAFRTTRNFVLNGCDFLNSIDIQPLGFHGEPVEEPVVIGWMPALSLYFKDPDNHSIEMLHVMDEEPDAEFGVQSYSRWLNR